MKSWKYPALFALAAAAVQPAAAQTVVFPENSGLRAGHCPSAAPSAALAGPDADLFEFEAGVLRFAVRERRRLLPDFEAPLDADGDNVYEVAVETAAAGGGSGATRQDCAFLIRVADADEPGRIALSASSRAAPSGVLRPVQGETLTAGLEDPDAPLEDVRWQWRRSVGIDAFADIPGADSAAYAPAAADTGRLLRVTARYRDRHGAGREAGFTMAHPVLGPRLLALSARNESDPAAAGLHPDFDPSVLHYAVACADGDVLSLNWTAPEGARADVDGVQPRPGASGGTARTVNETSDVPLTLAASDGGFTRYTVHCAPAALAGVRARGALAPLLGVTAGAWAAAIDENGAPRFHRRVAAGNASGGFFLKSFGLGGERRWVHGAAPENSRAAGGGWTWILSGADFEPLREIVSAPPLTVTGRHDFRLLEDGAALLMAYEPAERDFSFLSSPAAGAVRFDDPDGEPWGESVQTRDSAAQIVDAAGAARWTWNSWGRVPLEDCAQHSFPDDYAHINSARMTPRGVLVSLRGCSSVLLLDPDAPPGAEIVWRIGQSNLAAADWADRGLGPPPWPLAGDPEGAFCGQHAASLRGGGPEPRLLLFDNGSQCVENPAAGEPLSRRGGEFSRVVEYALDEARAEAVFLREHARDDAAFARSRGHVEVLPDGEWLISWGNTDGAAGGAMVSLVDPRTGAERFAVLGGELRQFTAVPVDRSALLRAPPPLAAAFPDGAPLADGVPAPDEGGDRNEAGPARPEIWLAVAFNRPVADFGADTPSIGVEGGELLAVRPWRAFGKPAHSYLLGLRPDSGAPLTVRLLAGADCAAGAICAADGAPLSEVPAPLALPE